MKRNLFLALLTGTLLIAFSNVSLAGTITFTKPSVKIDTSAEENAVNQSIKNTKTGLKNTEKNIRNTAKTTEKNITSGVKNAVSDVTNSINNTKKNIKEKQAAHRAQAKKNQQQRIEAIESFKNSFKNN